VDASISVQLAMVPSDDSRQFIDEGESLFPYTVYYYRITASTGRAG